MIVARRAGILSGMAVASVLIKAGKATLVGDNLPTSASKDGIHIGVDGRFVNGGYQLLASGI